MNIRTYEINASESLNTSELLTPSETSVAAGIACGMSEKEVAELNNISIITTKRHIQNIYDKTGIRRGLNSLAVWFLEKNLEIDMREIRRRAGAMVLLGIVSVQMVTADGSSFLRTRTTRCSTVRVRARRNENNNIKTYQL